MDDAERFVAVVDIDAQGWREVATPSIVQIMDGIHALFAGTVMVVGAKPLPRAYQIDALASYHREASLDDFYDMSQIVDTLLFVTIAFYGIFPIGELLLGQMLAKVLLSAILVPPVIYLLVGLGRRLDRQS